MRTCMLLERVDTGSTTYLLALDMIGHRIGGFEVGGSAGVVSGIGFTNAHHPEPGSNGIVCAMQCVIETSGKLLCAQVSLYGRKWKPKPGTGTVHPMLQGL